MGRQRMLFDNTATDIEGNVPRKDIVTDVQEEKRPFASHYQRCEQIAAKHALWLYHMHEKDTLNDASLRELYFQTLLSGSLDTALEKMAANEGIEQRLFLPEMMKSDASLRCVHERIQAFEKIEVFDSSMQENPLCPTQMRHPIAKEVLHEHKYGRSIDAAKVHAKRQVLENGQLRMPIIYTNGFAFTDDYHYVAVLSRWPQKILSGAERVNRGHLASFLYALHHPPGAYDHHNKTNKKTVFLVGMSDHDRFAHDVLRYEGNIPIEGKTFTKKAKDVVGICRGALGDIVKGVENQELYQRCVEENMLCSMLPPNFFFDGRMQEQYGDYFFERALISLCDDVLLLSHTDEQTTTLSFAQNQRGKKMRHVSFTLQDHNRSCRQASYEELLRKVMKEKGDHEYEQKLFPPVRVEYNPFR